MMVMREVHMGARSEDRGVAGALQGGAPMTETLSSFFFFFFFLELFLLSTIIYDRQIRYKALWAPYIGLRHDRMGSRLSHGVPSLLLLRPSVVSGSAQISRAIGGTRSTLPTKSYKVLTVHQHEGKAVSAREGRVGGG